MQRAPASGEPPKKRGRPPKASAAGAGGTPASAAAPATAARGGAPTPPPRPRPQVTVTEGGPLARANKFSPIATKEHRPARGEAVAAVILKAEAFASLLGCTRAEVHYLFDRL